MNRFIAIDLELEQPKSNPQTPDSMVDEQKIIQAGIVVFELNELEPTVLYSETMFIQYKGELSLFIRQLTGITNEQVNNSTNSPLYLVQRLVLLREKFNTSRQIVEWGSGDTQAILEESGVSEKNWIEKMGFARTRINVKTLYQCYALANGLKTVGGLSKSMGKLGMGFKSTHYEGKNRGVHWAESDVLNTARIFNKLIELMRKE